MPALYFGSIMGGISASAPGSIMITGEHAVVYGHPAIVAAIDQRIYVELKPHASKSVTITSAIAEPAEFDLDDLAAEGPYRFILAAVMRHRPFLDTGLAISVRSEIDPTLGLGSSAAVTVATLGGLSALTGQTSSSLHADALAIVQKIQGRGSGADLAASLTGGMVSYRIRSGHSALMSSLPSPPQLSLRYTGYKTPTAKVLARVAEARIGQEAKFDALYAQMGANAAETIFAIESDNWDKAGLLLSGYQDLMAELGVSDDTIESIIKRTQGTSGLKACKISGSGLGDCVLAVGVVPEGFTKVPLAEKGLMIDG